MKQAEQKQDSLCKDSRPKQEDAWFLWKDTLTDIGLLEDNISLTLYEKPIYLTMEKTEPKDTLILYHIHSNALREQKFSPPTIEDILTCASFKMECKKYNLIPIVRMFDGRGVWEYDVVDGVAVELNNAIKNSKTRDYRGNVIINSKTYTNIESVLTYEYNTRTNGILAGVVFTNETMVVNIKRKGNPYDSESIREYVSAASKVGIKLKFTALPANKK
jgi:hypothetical protein